MHKKLNPFGYGNIPLQPSSQSSHTPDYDQDRKINSNNNQQFLREVSSIDCWAGSVRHMRRVAGIFSARSPFCRPEIERVESKVQIGRDDFYAGEIAHGFVKRSPQARRVKTENKERKRMFNTLISLPGR
jgi:hypothetical protein